MRPIRLLLPLFLISFLFSGLTQKALADVFANNVRITQPGLDAPFDGNFADGTDAAIRFTLSDAADTVKVMIYDGSMTLIRTITELNYAQGDTSVAWDGKDDSDSPVGTGTYSLSIYTSSAGYNDYTEIYYDGSGNGLSTRGVTSIKSQSVKNFGFQYGIWSTIVRRYANDGEAWGDVKGNNELTSVTPMDDRYSPEADSMGYVYFLGYSNHWVYRFNVDTLVQEVVDSTSIKNLAVGIGIKGKGNDAYLTLAAESNIFGMQLTDGFHSGAIDTLVNQPGYTFWDVTVGRGNMIYSTYYSSDDSLPGVAAFDMSKFSGTPLTLADADWTVIGDSGRANTLTYDFASNPANDVIYYTIARRKSGDANAHQNIYSITDLAGTRTQDSIYIDKQNNMSQFRSDVAVDAAHNIIFFENSNEENALISPPTGFNSYTYMDPFSEIKVFSSEDISGVKVDADADGQPDRLGETVTVTGIVNSINFTKSSNATSYFIQDLTGGINIFKSSDTSRAFNIGDRMLVTGKVAFYNGTTELAISDLATDINLLDTGNPVNPTVITLEEYLANPEKYESMYIQIKGLAKTSGTWPTTGSTSLTLWDGYNSVLLRIDSDTDLGDNTEPVYPIDVKGVATQFTSSAPYNTGYQISPNAFSDITANVPVPPSKYFSLVTPSDSMMVVITDSAQMISFNWQSTIDLNGDALIYQLKLLPSVYTSGVISDTTTDLAATLILGKMTGDTLTVPWTINSKGKENTIVGSVDTFMVTFINNISTVGVTDKFVPKTFYVDQNYPNPFNPATTIKFGLPKDQVVDLRVYNILGQQVAVLINNQSRAAGSYNVRFNAATLASGTYIYRLTAGNNVVTKKMVLLK
jgi:hypothetical protein